MASSVASVRLENVEGSILSRPGSFGLRWCDPGYIPFRSLRFIGGKRREGEGSGIPPPSSPSGGSFGRDRDFVRWAPPTTTIVVEDGVSSPVVGPPKAVPSWIDSIRSSRMGTELVPRTYDANVSLRGIRSPSFCSHAISKEGCFVRSDRSSERKRERSRFGRGWNEHRTHGIRDFDTTRPFGFPRAREPCLRCACHVRVTKQGCDTQEGWMHGNGSPGHVWTDTRRIPTQEMQRTRRTLLGRTSRHDRYESRRSERFVVDV